MPEGADELRRWLDVHPEVRLIGVDVWAKMRPKSDPNASGYESDYLSTYTLKAIADEYGVCIIVVHHTRKQASDDWLDTISGTQGLAGGCDGLLVLRRQRGAAAAELLVTGRDVEEATHALSFAADLGAWTLLEGPAEDYTLHETRRAVLHLLRDHPGLTPKAIAEKLGIAPATIRQTVGRMVDDEQLDTDGAGTYFLPLQSAVTPVTDVTQLSDSSDSSDTSREEDE